MKQPQMMPVHTVDYDPFSNGQLASTQLTAGHGVVKNRSRNTLKCKVYETFAVHRVAFTSTIDTLRAFIHDRVQKRLLHAKTALPMRRQARCRANWAHIRQSRPDSGRHSSHFSVQMHLTRFRLVPSRPVAAAQIRLAVNLRTNTSQKREAFPSRARI